MSTYTRILSVLFACLIILAGFYGAYLAPVLENGLNALLGGVSFLLMALGLTIIVLTGMVREKL